MLSIQDLLVDDDDLGPKVSMNVAPRAQPPPKQNTDDSRRLLLSNLVDEHDSEPTQHISHHKIARRKSPTKSTTTTNSPPYASKAAQKDEAPHTRKRALFDGDNKSAPVLEPAQPRPPTPTFSRRPSPPTTTATTTAIPSLSQSLLSTLIAPPRMPLPAPPSLMQPSFFPLFPHASGGLALPCPPPVPTAAAVLPHALQRTTPTPPKATTPPDTEQERPRKRYRAFLTEEGSSHSMQCIGFNQKKNIRCGNAALMDYVGPRPQYCAEHIHLDTNSLYQKCVVVTVDPVTRKHKYCKEVVLKEFEACFKHLPQHLAATPGLRIRDGAACVRRCEALLARVRDLRWRWPGFSAKPAGALVWR